MSMFSVQYHTEILISLCQILIWRHLTSRIDYKRIGCVMSGRDRSAPSLEDKCLFVQV